MRASCAKKADALAHWTPGLLLVAKQPRGSETRSAHEVWEPEAFSAHCAAHWTESDFPTYHEIVHIPGSTALALFVDLEEEPPQRSVENWTTEVCDRVAAEVRQRAGRPLAQCERWDSVPFAGTKFSTHLHFPEIIFPSLLAMRNFMRDVHRAVSVACLDMAVYSHGSLRMPYMRHGTTRRVLVPFGYTGEEHFNPTKFANSFILASPRSAPAQHLPALERYSSSSSSSSSSPSSHTLLTEAEVKNLQQYVRGVYWVETIDTSRDTNDSVCWLLHPGVYCPFKGAPHRSNGTYLRIDRFKRADLFCLDCHRAYFLDVSLAWILTTPRPPPPAPTRADTPASGSCPL